MSNNDGHDFRLGLGSMSSTTYFTAMSNTAEKDNTPQQFVNEPYAGIHFNSEDLDIPVTGWTTQLLTLSIPHHNQMWDSVAHDIWIKRVQIGGAWDGSSEPEQMNLYTRLADDKILFSPDAHKWKYLLDSYPPIRPRPDDARAIVKYGLTQPTKYPQALEDFMNLTYNYDKSPIYPNHVIKMYPMMTIKKLPAAASTANKATKDTFDIILKRDGASSKSTYRNSFDAIMSENAGGYYQLLRISRTLAIILGIEEWNEQQYFPVSSDPDPASSSSTYQNNYKEFLSDFSNMVNISDSEVARVQAYARELYPDKDITLKQAGVTGAKMFLCGESRSFVYNIIGRNYDPHKSPYRPAMGSAVTANGTEPWYSGPHFYGSKYTWDKDTQHKYFDPAKYYNLGWDEGQYVDVIVCIQNTDQYAVGLSSDSFYNYLAKYEDALDQGETKRKVPLPRHTSIACKYIPRGVPLYLSHYLRNTEYHHYTAHIRSPNLIYPNTASGRLESTVDILKTNYPSEIKPWTSEWFQIVRPIPHRLRLDLYENRLLFKLDIIHSASTQLTLLTDERMSDEAMQYYSQHSKYIMTTIDSAPIGMTFVFHPIFDEVGGQ